MKKSKNTRAKRSSLPFRLSGHVARSREGELVFLAALVSASSLTIPFDPRHSGTISLYSPPLPLSFLPLLCLRALSPYPLALFFSTYQVLSLASFAAFIFAHLLPFWPPFLLSRLVRLSFRFMISRFLSLASAKCTRRCFQSQRGTRPQQSNNMCGRLPYLLHSSNKPQTLRARAGGSPGKSQGENK